VEVDEAISAISEAGWLRLQKVANIYSYQGKFDHEELLQESFLAAIEGRRKCPRDVDIVRFLAEAMRSLVSSKMKSMERKPELKLLSLAPDNDENEMPYDCPSGDPSAEQAIVSIQEVEGIRTAILSLFDDDEIAQVIIEGKMEEMDAAELRDLTGLDKKGYDSKWRLIRRRIDRAYPEGWKQ
jgi:DNA-directed RNA polymerase specialized sigma24 family protein